MQVVTEGGLKKLDCTTKPLVLLCMLPIYFFNDMQSMLALSRVVFGDRAARVGWRGGHSVTRVNLCKTLPTQ